MRRSSVSRAITGVAIARASPASILTTETFPSSNMTMFSRLFLAIMELYTPRYFAAASQGNEYSQKEKIRETKEKLEKECILVPSNGAVAVANAEKFRGIQGYGRSRRDPAKHRTPENFRKISKNFVKNFKTALF